MQKYCVHSPYKRIVKSIRFKKPCYTAHTLFKSLPNATLREVLNAVRRECESMCKVKPSSLLRSSSVAELKQMEWASILDELKARAPVLLSIITEAATSRSGSSRAPLPTIIAMAVAIVLKSRSKNMCKL